jgi:hypothetical protein
VPARIRDVVSNASALPSRGKIKMEMVGGALILKGEVNSDTERALAETIVRLEPGVYDVRNELTLPQPPAPAAIKSEPLTPTPPAPKNPEPPAPKSPGPEK